MGLETLVAACGPVGLSTGVSKLLTLLVTIQAAALASLGGGPNFDPKYFVDIPLRFSVSETTQAFEGLPRLQNNTIAPSACSSPPLNIALFFYLWMWGSQLVAHGKFETAFSAMQGVGGA